MNYFKCVCVRMYAYVRVVCMLVYVCVRLCIVAYVFVCVVTFRV